MRSESYQLADGWQRLERAGQGATSEVWRARHPDGRVVALKTARSAAGADDALAREGALLARTARRWGPALVDAAPGWIAIEWTEGAAVDPRSIEGDREKLAAVIAHGVGRALEELHDARVRHGDVKPANVLLSQRVPTRDSPSDRGATLVDLGLSADVEEGALGGTARYAAPELRAAGEAGIAADLWALGLLLGELLDPRVAAAADPCAAMRAWDRAGRSEPARWA
ncbi:MAG: protein kinase domain-containing protein, partial [Polyangiaceae bacterium]